MVCLAWKTTFDNLYHHRIFRLRSYFPPCLIPVTSTGHKHDNTGTKVGTWRTEGAGVNLIYLFPNHLCFYFFLFFGVFVCSEVQPPGG